MTFTKEETPTIMDGLVIRWEGKASWANTPEISASRGLMVYLFRELGLELPVENHFDKVIKVLNEAYSAHIKLKEV